MTLKNEDRPSDSPYIHRVWRSQAERVSRMTSIATSTWEIVFWEHEGRGHAAIRGAETVASTAEVPEGSTSFGITFAHGALMPHLPSARLVDNELQSVHVDETSFVLRDEVWQTPNFDSAEQFVDRLVREGILVRDPLVDDVVAGETPPLGRRSIERRVAAATGLTQSSIRQIERARHAALLLAEGRTPLDVVNRLGFYDQPHLARSLKRFIGLSATDLRMTKASLQPMSLLYKTGIDMGS